MEEPELFKISLGLDAVLIAQIPPIRRTSQQNNRTIKFLRVTPCPPSTRLSLFDMVMCVVGNPVLSDSETISRYLLVTGLDRTTLPVESDAIPMAVSTRSIVFRVWAMYKI